MSQKVCIPESGGGGKLDRPLHCNAMFDKWQFIHQTEGVDTGIGCHFVSKSESSTFLKNDIRWECVYDSFPARVVFLQLERKS